MTIIGDHEAAHFVRQSVAVMQFFSQLLTHELSLRSWTSRALFAHFINFNKGLYLVLALKRFKIFKGFISGV